MPKQLKIDQPSDADYSDVGIFRPDILTKAFIQFDEASKYWDGTYKVAARDKGFLQSKQWDKKTIEERAKAGKASTTAPLIGSYFREKMGHLLPGEVNFSIINTNPRDSAGVDITNQRKNDESISRVLNGAIKFVDWNSNAKIHRNRARKEQCSGGIGWLSLAYKDSPGVSDGEVVVNSPRLTSSIYIDPFPENPDFSDAMYSFQIFPMSWAELKGKYGEKATKIRNKEDIDGDIVVNDVFTANDFDGLYSHLESTQDKYLNNDGHMNNWFTTSKKEVNVAVWYRRVEKEETYYRLSDGRELTEEDYDTIEKEGLEEGFEELEITDIRKETGWKVERRVITGWTVLEEDLDYFIDEIPHVPVLGYTVTNDDEVTYHSIIHDGVELQEKINLLESNGMKKASSAKSTGILPHGVAPDKVTKIATLGDIEFIGIDPTMGGVSPGDKNSGIQVIQNPDNGSVEFSQIPIHIEMLKQVLSVTDNDNRGSINSAAQLQLQLEQEIVVFNELDANYKMALNSLYRKVLKAIINTTSQDEYLNIIDPSSDEDKIAAEKIQGDVAALKYDISVKLSQSGQIQRRNEQIILDNLSNPIDPVLRTSVIPDIINSSPIKNKERTLTNWARVMIADGKSQYLPPDLLQNTIEDMQESGQLIQYLNNQAQALAEQMANQKIQELVQTGAVQASMAASQATIAQSQARTQQSVVGLQRDQIKAATDANKVAHQSIQEAHQTEQDRMQLEQQREQTKQGGLRTQQEILELRQKELDLELANIKAGSDVVGENESTTREAMQTEQKRIDLMKSMVSLETAMNNADAKTIDLIKQQLDTAIIQITGSVQ